MASNRIGGVISLTIDGANYSARGNFEVSPNIVRREGIAGQDGVHGYTEMPVVPSIKGDLTTTDDFSISTLANITNSTIQCALGNGSVFILNNAWVTAQFAINTAEGRFGVEFQGMSCTEL